MNETARLIFNRLRASGFAGLEGAEAAVVLPISDRLLTEVIRTAFPAVSQLREFEVKAAAGNLITVWIRLGSPAFLPGFRIRLQVESQPQLPSTPVLVLRLLSRGLAALAGPAASFLDALPKGIALDGDRLSVNVAVLLERYGATDAIRYLRVAQLATGDGLVLVTLRAALPPGGQTSSFENG